MAVLSRMQVIFSLLSEYIISHAHKIITKYYSKSRSPTSQPVTSNNTQLIHSKLAANIIGKEYRVPNLGAVLSPLRVGFCSSSSKLEQRINSRLDQILTYPAARKKVQKVNLPLFISRWYPFSTLESQEALALYNMWLFIWDDVFDGEDDQKAQPQDMNILFTQTISYVEYHLGLCDAVVEEPVAPTWATSLFKHAGEALIVQTDINQRRRFFEEIKYYVNSCANEHKIINKGVLPSLEQYWDFRWGTSSVYTHCALADFMAGVELPDDVFTAKEIRALWMEVNRNITIVNDILSLKKEIHGSMNSLIPIMMHETGKSLDQVISELIVQLQATVRKFSDLSEKLLATAGHDSEVRTRLLKYIEVLEYSITGHYYWSLECGRYKMAESLQADGSLLIKL